MIILELGSMESINKVEAGTSGTIAPEIGSKSPSSRSNTGKTGKSKKHRTKRARVVIDCDPSKLLFTEETRHVIRRIYNSRKMAILDLRTPLNEFIQQRFEGFVKENYGSFFNID
jgi:hypothetical protein